MKTGRPRKPKEVLIAQGTYRKHRDVPTLQGVKLTSIPSPPEFLYGRSIDYFKNICNVLLEYDLLTVGDILLITQLAQALQLNENAWDHMKEKEPVQTSATGFHTISGWYSVYEKTSKQIRELSNLFGLNPSAREKFTIKEPDPEENPLRKLMNS